MLKIPAANPADPAVDKAPTPIQLGQAGLLGKTCRVMCSTTSVAASATAASSKRKIKLSAVVNQDDECDVDILDEVTVANAYARYTKRIGAFPRAEEELSQEQLSGLHALFKSGRAPYVDMAVWGPYHHRLERKRRLSGVRLNQYGEIQTVELTGPSDFEAWRERYAVFKVGAIMFDEISPARLDAYEKHVRNYHERYGRSCWALIYQADVRARLENSERLRRVGKDEHDKAKKAGGTHDFDTNSPWEWVWNALIEDLRFWHSELEEPALLVLAKSTKMEKQLGDDAPVDAPKPTPSDNRPGPGGGGNKRKQQAFREHRLGDDGFLTHNRRGAALCGAFQVGKCLERDRWGNCSKDGQSKHQCSKSEDHGSAVCPSSGPKAPRTFKGKGGGGGGKKGGKAKRN